MVSLDRAFGMDGRFDEDPIHPGDGSTHASLGDGCSCTCSPNSPDLCDSLTQSAEKKMRVRSL